MLRIAIYEKDPQNAKTVFETASNLVSQLRIGCELTVFTDLGKLITKFKRDIHWFQVFFFNASDEQSLRLARRIRYADFSVSLIFCVHEPLADQMHLIQFRPSVLLTRPSDPKQMGIALRTVNEEQKYAHPFFAVKTREEILRIDYADICFLESNKRVITLHTDKMRTDFYGKLNEIQQMLPAHMFIRCHQSYIVNMDKVVALDKINRVFKMTRGFDVEISKSCYPQVLQLYDAFIRQ